TGVQTCALPICDHVLAAIEGNNALAASLALDVPASWPPEGLDESALRYLTDRLTEVPESGEWWGYWIILRQEPAGRMLIGSAGYKGPPTADGSVEIGYGIVNDYQRQGFASEAARGLVGRAFQFEAVHRVRAETFPELIGS